MKPTPFSYFEPETNEEVLVLLAEHGWDARLLAGGQSLVPLMNLRLARPEVVIDLNRCAELETIEQAEGAVSYGPMVRQIDAERSRITRGHCPLISKALAHAGPGAVRIRATVGGTLAHADRTAELPGVAMALGTTLVLESSSGRREVPAQEFFLGDLTTTIEPEEMLRAAVFPVTGTNTFSDFFEIGLRREGAAIAGLAAHIVLEEGSVVKETRLAVIGVGSRPVRLESVEATLKGQELTPALIAQVRDIASESVDPTEDAHATARYRKHVTGALVKKALEGAVDGFG